MCDEKEQLIDIARPLAYIPGVIKIQSCLNIHYYVYYVICRLQEN